MARSCAVEIGKPSHDFAILASSLPQAKLGIYIGLFNVFVVVPQLLVATVMGSIMNAFFPTEPIWTMAFAAATLLLAVLAMLRMQVTDHVRTGQNRERV